MNAFYRHSPAARRAFTLVELLVSVSLTALLMWGILNLYSSATRFSATVFTETELVGGARAVLDRMCQELGSMTPLDVGYLKITRDTVGADSSADSIQFVAPVGDNGALADVLYELRLDNGRYMLYRGIKTPATINGPAPPDRNAYAASPMGVAVDSMRILYIDDDTTDGTPVAPAAAYREWRDANLADGQVPRLPRSIIIELRLADAKGSVLLTITCGTYLGGSGI